MAAATVQTVALGAPVRGSAFANASASSKPAVFGKGFMGQAVVQRASFPAKKATKVAAQAAVEVKLPLELEKNDANNLPLNTFSNKKPCIGKIVSVVPIVGPKAPGETCHIIIDHGGQMPFVEGQSYGVIPPGDNPKKPGKPNTVRLYSIASTRYGDTDFNGKTTSLCVRRAEYFDPVTGQKDPAKKGICSNFLCDAKPGDEVVLTGPTGKVMLLPESPNATVIMLATGTGIAPYRAFIRRAFVERPPNYQFNGLMWLFLGVANTDSLLYEDDWQDILKKFPKNFRYDKALSREQKNAKGGKMYIQDKVEEYGEEVFKMLQDGAHIYFCGLKGMMPGIIDMMTAVAEKKGLNWTEFSEELKHKGQWHVEVY